MMLIMLIAAVFGAGSMAVQTNFLWSWKLVKPKAMHLNPMKGLKRIFSINNSVNTLKQIAKLCIIFPIAWVAFFDLFPQLRDLMELNIHEILPFTAMAASYVFWKIMIWLLILAILDLIWQKFRNKKQLKMSKHEVKEERKSVEGDEKTRRRIMAIGLQRARERMMKEVPSADVVVTNPTHFAVALKYTMEAGSSPKVVAKGRGYLAERIKRIAKENGVAVIERKTLAQSLYKMVEVGQEIPYELFKAVAELLAYVYRIKGKTPKKRRSRTEAQ